MNEILKVSHINKKYKDFNLKDISFTINKGSIMGFVGANGAGKSTTIKIIMDLIKKDSGDVIFFEDKKIDKDLKNDIGVVFEECYYPDMITAFAINKMCKGVYSKWDEECFYSYLERFNLRKDKEIKEYSKGMTMKLSIAMALSHNPKLLILDEATSGLDPIVRNEMLEIFSEFVEKDNHAILISSHIVSDLERLCDCITYIDNGEILFTSKKDELLSKYECVQCKEEKAQEFLGKYKHHKIRKDYYFLVPSGKFKEARPATIEDLILITNGRLENY